MASVQKRGKKWYAIWVDHTGRQRQRAGYTDKGETLRLAQRMEDEERKIRLGDVDPQAEARRRERAKPTADHVTGFRAHMESKGREPKHVQYTIRDVERCIEHTGITNASQLTIGMVDGWRSWCLSTGYATTKGGPPKPDSRKTANRRVASVRAWLRYLHRIGAVERVVLDGYHMLATKGHETRKRRALTRDEVARLIENTPDEARRELYRFAVFSGLRQNEIRSMRPTSFDFTRATITITAKHAKARREQTIPMHPCLVEGIRRLCEGKAADDPIFVVPRNQNIVGILHRDCQAAGIDITDVDFHALRHTYCTLLADSGVRPEVLYKLARHKDFATTLKFYIHLRPEDERAVLERL